MNPFVNAITDLQLLGAPNSTSINKSSSELGQTVESLESVSFSELIDKIVARTSNETEFTGAALEGQINQNEFVEKLVTGKKESQSEAVLDQIVQQLLTFQGNSERAKHSAENFGEIKESFLNFLNNKNQNKDVNGPDVGQLTVAEIKNALVQAFEENGIVTVPATLIGDNSGDLDSTMLQAILVSNPLVSQSEVSPDYLSKLLPAQEGRTTSEPYLLQNLGHQLGRQPGLNQQQPMTSSLPATEFANSEKSDIQSKIPAVSAIVSENSRVFKLQVDSLSNQEIADKLPSDLRPSSSLPPIHPKFLGATAHIAENQLEMFKNPGEHQHFKSLSTEGLPNGLSDASNSLTSVRLTSMSPGQSYGTSKVPMNSLAVHIATQANNGARRFEIRLDPPELGRIDVRLDFSREGSVRTHLMVELPETLEMLQRDARSLERALNDSGLQTSRDSLSFSLKDQGFAGQRSFGDEFEESAFSKNTQTNDVDDREENQDQTVNPNVIASNGLDIRI